MLGLSSHGRGLMIICLYACAAKRPSILSIKSGVIVGNAGKHVITMALLRHACCSATRRCFSLSYFPSKCPKSRSFGHLALRGHQLPMIRQAITIRASADPEEQRPSTFGLGGPGTWFGFGKKQEREVGRLAMVGFMAGVVMEVLTGKGILAQLGIDPVAVKYPFLAGLSFLLVGGLLGGYVVINNPPDMSKVPPNDGAGLPRNPLKTYDPRNIEPLTMWTRGGVVSRPSGQMGREPYASDLDLPSQEKD